MTKKVLSLLVVGAVATILVACGNNAEEAKSTCDSYLDYVQCSVEKTPGVDADQAKAAVDQTRTGLDQLPEDQKEMACTKAVEMLQKAPAVEGCDLPKAKEEVKEEAKEEAKEEVKEEVKE